MGIANRTIGVAFLKIVTLAMIDSEDNTIKTITNILQILIKEKLKQIRYSS